MRGSYPKKEVTVRGLAYVDPDLDFAVLRTDPGLPQPIKFELTDDVEPGDRLAIIGYPGRPPDDATFLSPQQIDQLFSAPNGRTPFPAERIALADLGAGVPSGYFAHDATTWGGNSA